MMYLIAEAASREFVLTTAGGTGVFVIAACWALIVKSSSSMQVRLDQAKLSFQRELDQIHNRLDNEE